MHSGAITVSFALLRPGCAESSGADRGDCVSRRPACPNGSARDPWVSHRATSDSSGASPSEETAISAVFWFMGLGGLGELGGLGRICAGPDTAKNGALYGNRACSHAAQPMSFWWPWPTRQPVSSRQCSTSVKPSELKRQQPHNHARKELYCEGNCDLMAKQGNTRDRPNPRRCPSIKLVCLTGRRSFGFHQGQRSTNRDEKAGYMTASSTAASNQFFPCNNGGAHT